MASVCLFVDQDAMSKLDALFATELDHQPLPNFAIGIALCRSLEQKLSKSNVPQPQFFNTPDVTPNGAHFTELRARASGSV